MDPPELPSAMPARSPPMTVLSRTSFRYSPLAVQVYGVEEAADDSVIRHEIVVSGKLEQDGVPQMPAIKGIAYDNIVPGIVVSICITLVP
ncbi:hypothetical protein [Bacillus sp. FJAT-18017]|uniref:hypothetical protein n=1 Tax=Bacillus sp. FJAT-18017 TaxID=1705566 RepID=UPI0012E2D062|nr:hypothetical protein [Bacillus sp. FJAT-18017]